MDNKTLNKLTADILRDIRVEVEGDIDEHFRRQGFYGEAWPRRRSPSRSQGSHLLLSTGALRRSIYSHTSAESITFRSDLPYAAIHNEGGEIEVTPRMKRYFWRKYYETSGSFGRRKDGSLRRTVRNRSLGSMADFYRAMALMKPGSKVKIPCRRFLGPHPRLEKAVQAIIEENIERYVQQLKLIQP